MKFNLKRPCKHCPFRTDVHPYLRPDRVREIIDSITSEDKTFACHETTEYDEEYGDLNTVITSSHCAGALIFLEKQGLAMNNNMLRTANRLRLYDHEILDMDSPVFSSARSMIEKSNE